MHSSPSIELALNRAAADLIPASPAQKAIIAGQNVYVSVDQYHIAGMTSFGPFDVDHSQVARGWGAGLVDRGGHVHESLDGLMWRLQRGYAARRNEVLGRAAAY